MLLRFFLDSKRSKGALTTKSVRMKKSMTDNDSPLRNEEDGLKLELTFDREVLDSEVVFPVVSQALVESGVLFLSNVIGVTRPDGLGLVQLFGRGFNFLDLLRLLLLGFVFFIFDFLNLGLLLVFLGFFLFVLDLLRYRSSATVN